MEQIRTSADLREQLNDVYVGQAFEIWDRFEWTDKNFVYMLLFDMEEIAGNC